MVTYDLGNLADWLGALGTIGAVIVALYLSRKDEKPRARVKATVSYGVTYTGDITEHPLQISMEIVNIGKVPIYLSECTISPSIFSKQRLYFPDESHKVKKLINPGEFYEHSLDYEPVSKYLRSKNLKRLKTYMFFRDSLDNKYKYKVILRT